MWVEPKLNGVRVLAVVKDGLGTLYSRDGRIVNNFDHMSEALVEVQKSLNFPNFVLDGELYLKGQFRKLMSVFSKDPENITDDDRLLIEKTKFVAFDYLTLEEFQDHGSSLPLRLRRRTMKQVTTRLGTDGPFRAIPHELAETMEEVLDLYKKLVAKGFEGAMVKDPGAPSQLIRGNHW